MGERVAIVEDHGLLAQTVATALRAHGVAVDVVDVALVDDPVDHLAQRPASVVLLDLDLGERGEATGLVEPLTRTGARVVLLTGIDDPLRHAACVEAGAVGVITKAVSFDELLDALRQVLASGTLLSKHDRDEYLARLRAYRRDEHERLEPFEELSRREAEVLGELMRGQTVEHVAGDAYVSVATVRTQVRAILRKLSVGSQVAAIGLAREAGWVPPQERGSR